MIEFIEESHTYLVNGEIVPSVTTILGATVFSKKYSQVPQYILDKAAAYGSAIHGAIETHDISGLNDNQIKHIIDYVKLLKSNDISELEHEQLLHYGYEYAGTYDLKALYQNEEILCDIKTTSKLDLEYLSWQLSMYARAIDFSGKLFCFWLPRPKYGVATFIEVERKSDEEIDSVLEQFKELQNEKA